MDQLELLNKAINLLLLLCIVSASVATAIFIEEWRSKKK